MKPDSKHVLPFPEQQPDDSGNNRIVLATAWPDLTAHDRAWKQAVKELGATAPLRELIRRAHEILREAPHQA